MEEFGNARLDLLFWSHRDFAVTERPWTAAKAAFLVDVGSSVTGGIAPPTDP